MSEDNWFARGFLYAMRVHVGDFRRDDPRILAAFRLSSICTANDIAENFDEVFGTFEGFTRILLEGSRDFIVRIEGTPNDGGGERIRFRIEVAEAAEALTKTLGALEGDMRELALSLRDLALPVTETKNDDLARRVDRIEAILRQAKLHEPGCPADHNCLRDHPHQGVYCARRPCTCWLSKP